MGAGGRRVRACAAAKRGVIMTWGSDADGQLGNGAAGGHLKGAALPGMTGVIDMSGGREHVVALKQNGTVWAWGHNNDGQVGDGTKTNRTAPVQPTTPASSGPARPRRAASRCRSRA